jgi:hypothetical protein
MSAFFGSSRAEGGLRTNEDSKKAGVAPTENYLNHHFCLIILTAVIHMEQ